MKTELLTRYEINFSKNPEANIEANLLFRQMKAQPDDHGLWLEVSERARMLRLGNIPLNYQVLKMNLDSIHIVSGYTEPHRR